MKRGIASSTPPEKTSSQPQIDERKSKKWQPMPSTHLTDLEINISQLNNKSQEHNYQQYLHKIEMKQSYNFYIKQKKANHILMILRENPAFFFQSKNKSENLKLIIRNSNNIEELNDLLIMSIPYLEQSEKLDLAIYGVRYQYSFREIIKTLCFTNCEKLTLAENCIPEFAGMQDFYNNKRDCVSIFTENECLNLRNKAINKLNIILGSLDEQVRYVENLIANDDLNELKLFLFNILTRKPAFYSTMLSAQASACMSVCTFSDDDISHFNILVREFLVEYREAVIEYGFEKTDCHINEPRPYHWSRERRNPQPNKLVNIEHGGGICSISNFILGKTNGYLLEKGGLGIQVATNPLGREQFYAFRNCFGFCDEPAKFSAKIKAKYLDSAPNGYEAGLRPQYAKYLQDIQIERFSYEKSDIVTGNCFVNDYLTKHKE